MIDKSMCEPKEDDLSEKLKFMKLILRAVGAAVLIAAAIAHFGIYGWATICDLYLYIEGLRS